MCFNELLSEPVSDSTEAPLELLLNNIQEAVIYFEIPDLTIRWTNPQISILRAGSSEELKGRKCYEATL